MGVQFGNNDFSKTDQTLNLLYLQAFMISKQLDGVLGFWAFTVNLDVSSAKFSGRGTQMMSRNGIATISHYLCFKNGYTDDEIK